MIHGSRALLGLELALALLAGCTRGAEGSPHAKAAPAKVTPASGGGAPTLELAPSAAERLGLTLAEVEQRPVQRTRVLPGELVVPPGARAELRAPNTAWVSFGAHLSTVLGLGAPLAVAAGETLFALAPVPLVEGEQAAALRRAQLAQAANQLALARVASAGALARARARRDAAQTAFQRAEALVAAEAGSPRARDEARAELEAATAETADAERQRALLDAQSLPSEPAVPAALELRAPFAGELVELSVAAGQVVPAGALLGVLECHDRLWIRVPLFAEAPPEAGQGSARLAGADGRVPRDAPEARAIDGFPSADAAHATIDRWFEVANPARGLRPGQRVSVALPWTGEEARLIVPWSALVFDAQGGAWVYEHLGETRYQRVAVEFERALGGEALLLRGPVPGSSVVRSGAAELYGTEFGNGH